MDESFVIERLNDIRIANGWSLYKLAQKANVPLNTVRNILVYNHQPTILTLSKICNGLGISMVEFFDVGLSKEQITDIELVRRIEKLNKSQRKLVDAYIDGLLDANNIS